MNTYKFEFNHDNNSEDIQRLIEALRLIKKDDTLQIEERKIIAVSTNRQDVAAVLEPLAIPVVVKKTWSKKPAPASNINIRPKDRAEPAGIAPYQG